MHAVAAKAPAAPAELAHNPNCRDLSTFGDTVAIGVTKDGVRFSTNTGSAYSMLRCALFDTLFRLQQHGNSRQCQHHARAGRRAHSNMDKPEENVSIDMQEPVAQTYALNYLKAFARASVLSPQVCGALQGCLVTRKHCSRRELPALKLHAGDHQHVY